MCNAANHSPSCDCGFGGDTGGGGRHWGSVSNFTKHYSAPSFGWARDHGGTVESYVNPNAHCPVCGCAVFFYRSPYNGRVFFDRGRSMAAPTINASPSEQPDSRPITMRRRIRRGAKRAGELCFRRA
jgi:hypothetical protein